MPNARTPRQDGGRGAHAGGSGIGRRIGGLAAVRWLREGRMSIWAGLTFVLVVAGIVASVLAARSVAHSQAEKSRLAFKLSADSIAATLKLAIQHEEDLVVSASAFVTGTPNLTAAGFDRWVESVQAMRRYPELRDIGLVKLVPASQLAQFKRRLAADPVRPMGPNSSAPSSSFQVIPSGQRPYYCFAVAGLTRSAATYLPAGLDYCALAPALVGGREKGVAEYAPFVDGATTTLGVETPVYRGGVVPPTVAARRADFVGWLGELIEPSVVLAQAVGGHSKVAVTFTYRSGSSHVAFSSGSVPANALRSTIVLHNGWTVQAFRAPISSAIIDNTQAITLLIAGVLLSLLFGVLVLVLGTGRRRALTLVREKTSELSHLALHDSLTGLPNRALVLDRAAQMLARAAREPGTTAGALFIDIDGFKHVNDNLGHAAGDQLLRIVADRLRGAVREQDTVGRLGGDEFVVLVESRAVDEATFDVTADRLTDALRAPIELEDGHKVVSVTASVGVAVGQYATPDDLLRDADLALYAAKAAGKDRYALFDASMYSGAEGNLELQADLGAAIREEQFFLVYQPIFDLTTRALVGVEALVRWNHPRRGIVGPDRFIMLAEESGLIVPIGRWVLEEACRQAAAWAADGLEIGVSVNVSAYQLGRRGFAEDVERALRESRIEPSSLILEITETTLMRDVPGTYERLEEVKALGVRVAIDDFGTGYASLSHLQRMPVDILKIDRSFVSALNGGGQSRELLEAILGVGRALSLTVVAEGIEDPSQMATLEELSCGLAQGFLMGAPSSPDAIGNLPRADSQSDAVAGRTG